MVDKAFIIREAQKYLAKGQIDKAISEWENLLAASPDANSFNIAGDLYLKKNDPKSALDKFHRAADIFRKEGFSLKALAIYKKILNISPSDAKSNFALGELSEEKNITADAIRYYLSAADVLLKDGRKDEAVHAFRKVTRLEPDNLSLRKKLAETFSKEGFTEETAHEYVEIARILETQGEKREALKYLERSVEIKPGNRAALMAIASTYEGLGDREKALESLKLAMARTGKSDVLLLWTAKLHLESGDFEKARESARELLLIDPENIAAARLIASSYAKAGQMKAAWDEYAGVLEKLIAKDQLPEAIEILEGFRGAEPVEARKKLVPLYRQKGETGPAVRELKELVRLFEERGDAEAVRLCVHEALELAPEDEPLREKFRLLERAGVPDDDAVPQAAAEAPEPQAAPEETAAPATPDTADEKDTQDTADEKTKREERPVADILNQAGRFIGLGLMEQARRLLEPLRLAEPSNLELHLKLKSVYAGSGENELAVTECIILAELFRRAGREPEMKEMIGEAFRINPGDPRLIERWGQSPEVKAGKPETAAPAEDKNKEARQGESPRDLRRAFTPRRAEFTEKLAEAAFYTGQGLYDEAENIYNEFLAHFPEDSNARAKLAELAALRSEPDNLLNASGGLTVSGNADGDVTKITVPADGDLEKLFADFKKGVEKELDPADTDSHYNLGIAYKEMGLLDDAIRELKSVRDNPAIGPRASSVLAACHVEKGEFKEAIEALRGAVEKTDPADETHWGLKYDLAAACERNSLLDEALRLYTEIHRWNPAFRDASARIEALKKAAPEATPEAAPPEAQSSPGASLPPVAGPADGEKMKNAKPAPPRRNRISYI